MKHGGMKNPIRVETAESLLLTANNDFVCVLILWYSGVMIGSTYAWMLPHTLEKYLKSYLLKVGVVDKKTLRSVAGKDGHDIEMLWTKWKEVSGISTAKPKLNAAFDEIVAEMATIKTQMRYSGYIEYSSQSLLYYYIVLCSFIRYCIIGKKAYRESLYGLDESRFLLMNYHPMSHGYARIIVQKMLHLALEHAYAFTNMGFVNSMNFDEESISNTAIFQKLSDCPICNKSPQELLTMINFYRDIHPTPVDSSNNQNQTIT